jgi:hypothetical protein
LDFEFLVLDEQFFSGARMLLWPMDGNFHGGFYDAGRMKLWECELQPMWQR